MRAGAFVSSLTCSDLPETFASLLLLYVFTFSCTHMCIHVFLGIHRRVHAMVRVWQSEDDLGCQYTQALSCSPPPHMPGQLAHTLLKVVLCLLWNHGVTDVHTLLQLTSHGSGGAKTQAVLFIPQALHPASPLPGLCFRLL